MTECHHRAQMVVTKHPSNSFCPRKREREDAGGWWSCLPRGHWLSPAHTFWTTVSRDGKHNLNNTGQVLPCVNIWINSLKVSQIYPANQCIIYTCLSLPSLQQSYMKNKQSTSFSSCPPRPHLALSSPIWPEVTSSNLVAWGSLYLHCL